jgi:hypothetical protein
MLTLFEELNLYAYHRLRGALLDVVIWCLHPLIHDTRQYGLVRLYLAAATCKACRSWYRIRD